MSWGTSHQPWGRRSGSSRELRPEGLLLLTPPGGSEKEGWQPRVGRGGGPPVAPSRAVFQGSSATSEHHCRSTVCFPHPSPSPLPKPVAFGRPLNWARTPQKTTYIFHFQGLFFDGSRSPVCPPSSTIPLHTPRRCHFLSWGLPLPAQMTGCQQTGTIAAAAPLPSARPPPAFPSPCSDGDCKGLALLLPSHRCPSFRGAAELFPSVVQAGQFLGIVRSPHH